MKEKNFISLLHKQLTDRLEEDERANLTDWRDNSSDNEQLAARVEKAWKLSESYDPSFDPSVEKGLSRLKQRIAEAKEVEAVPKPGRVVPLQRRFFLRIAAAAVLAVGLFGIWQVLNPSVQSNSMVTLEEIRSVELSDGTQVTANANSQLIYPESFPSSERRVQLKGEAYFDVAENPEKPFIIDMDGASVQVLGTSFNIRETDTEIELTVRSGKVRFEALGETLDLTAGQRLLYTIGKGAGRLGKDEQLNALAWKSKQLVFKDTPMSDVVRYMENYYGVDIQMENAQLQDCRFNANYDDTSLDDALEVLTITYGVDIRNTQPNTYILSGGNCK